MCWQTEGWLAHDASVRVQAAVSLFGMNVKKWHFCLSQDVRPEGGFARVVESVSDPDTEGKIGPRG